MNASSVLYDDAMVRKMETEIQAGLEHAAETVREREEWLEEQRLERDRVIWEASRAGYSLGEIAAVTELAKSTVALVVKMETLRRVTPG
jgi:DNA-binding NarL/FixJ family response regulator